MRARRISRDELPLARLAGLVLCRDARDGSGARVLEKGRVLTERDVELLPSLAWDELHLVEMEPGDVHEERAGAMLARLAAGEGTVPGTLSGGHWPVCATTRGLLRVDVERLRRANEIEGVCVYTLFDGQVVDAGEAVARTKITPFVLEGARVRAIEALSRETAEGLVRVRPFLPTRVGAVVQETLGDRAMARFRDALAEKVEWLGSELAEPLFVPPRPEGVAGAIEALARGGARVIALAGSRAMDPLDPAFEALGRLGAVMERHGVPAHPGSLFWLARWRETPILGMPSCGLFSQASVFDLVLPRILAGEPFGRAELAAMGHGGFLTRDMAFRFPPYRARGSRGEAGE
ncbi:MAG TPA: hypothetical protein VFS05_02580 [Gemmatimonadaceae bacterium]|nr:hypothetical protein [Gemmatimonadaceae bacterium]